MRRALASFTLAAGMSFAAGCILVTGGTGGYTQAGGSDSGGMSCTSAADCGDGGQVCCLVVSASATAASGTCEPTCSIPSSYPQLCATSAECGDAGSCNKQSCTVNVSGSSVPVSLKACGMVQGCTGS